MVGRYVGQSGRQTGKQVVDGLAAQRPSFDFLGATGGSRGGGCFYTNNPCPRSKNGSEPRRFFPTLFGVTTRRAG
jgi:hypothetical protein